MLLADMTFHQFLQNPTGPYSSFFGKRENIKLDLEKRFYNLLSGYKKDFPCKVYKDKNDYYFYIKVPSETYSSIMYDVVIKLFPKHTYVLTEGTFSNYNLQFYSNSPAFVYTYAYISKKDKLLIDFMQNKLNKQSLTQPPSVRNPVEIYGFEKSIYFALLFIEYKNYHIKTAIPPNVIDKSFSKANINSQCQHSDDVMKKYNTEKLKESNFKKNEKRNAKLKNSHQKNAKIREMNKEREEKRKELIKNKTIKPKKKL